MSELKLSEVLEDLKKVTEIGVEIRRNLYGEVGYFDPNDYDDEGYPDKVLHWTDQALMVASLEQYAEFRGYWFVFGKQLHGENYTARILKSKASAYDEMHEDYCYVHYAPTRLQAALAAFLEVFDAPRANPNS
jgi:hypothetical protein